MNTDARREHLSNILRPAAPPRELVDIYTEDQRQRLLDVVHRNGPWKLIIAQHFSSVDALIATLSGAMPAGITPTLDMFLTPTFRGYYASYSAPLYSEIADCFYNQRFLDYAKSYWKAQYAKPQMMLFNVNGPCANTDPGHLDTPSFRGVRYESAPTWLCSVMGKSGLFKDYLIKMAQVITWFSNDPQSGFTYWPEGPLNPPKRLMPPVYNRGVLVQNEMMLHRGEANGPRDQQYPDGLGFDTVFQGDPSDRNGWLLKTGDRVIARHSTDDLRFLVHWSAEVFEDYAELKKNMDRSADLTLDQVFETLIKDVRSKGIEITPPADPLADPLFIRTLNAAYDFGPPVQYPADAPLSPLRIGGARAA
ncbi:hypothetical protein FBZ87_11641 [Nitrospirillum amazonense]|uniref:Uncharacterized protein n=1 Tax=Nitrospirillum amazonense TaxID=28077 RepID=A0A560J4Y7_9PROT|nr:hypothetical protein [Nitrospirillum amazonense]TWB18402.1 hypothetical protein FBZ89_11047 [Nitrospirillum amazonense]TWB66077.1 hypothetical protein FBZ87_11641 [Nitrospirillum amazonense]